MALKFSQANNLIVLYKIKSLLTQLRTDNEAN